MSVSRINIAPIVEGHGDNAAVRLLLQRIWLELLGGEHAEVLQPIRRKRGLLLKRESGDLERAVNLAVAKLAQVGGGLVLILVDAEEDCAALGSLGPLLLERATSARADADIACVIANVMYETWFVAAAGSLTKYLDDEAIQPIPEDPEAQGLGKGWVKSRIRSGKYTETADQAAMTSAMDLTLCRNRSRSFDKLCRELQRRLHG